MALVVAAVAPEGTLGTEPPVDVADRAERLRQAVADPGRGAGWVVEEAGDVVGHAVVTERSRGVLHLGMVLVPRARGRGGGRALIAAVLEHAELCGAHKLELEVWTDNARAIALYVSSGFEVEGIRRHHYLRKDGRLRSALLMARMVGPRSVDVQADPEQHQRPQGDG